MDKFKPYQDAIKKYDNYQKLLDGEKGETIQISHHYFWGETESLDELMEVKIKKLVAEYPFKKDAGAGGTVFIQDPLMENKYYRIVE